ncbi:hypothetical protein BS78_05G240200 [Paspalum vaginatum]|nr:hypothetical protein BS78_05G240200 [Paspalum vaginatum]
MKKKHTVYSLGREGEGPLLHATTSTPHRSRRCFASSRVVSHSVSAPTRDPPAVFLLLLPAQSPRRTYLPAEHQGPRDGVGGAVPDGGVVPGRGGPLRARRTAPRQLRRWGPGGGEAGAPPRLRHRVGRRALGLLRRRQRHVQMMTKRYKMEKDLGIGTEVGYSRNSEMAKKSPALAAMNREFRMIHGLSTLASIMAFGSLAIHSWYLSSKLDL